MDFSHINYYALSGIFNFFVSLIFATFVYLKDPRGQINKRFFFFAASVMAWAGPYFFWQVSTDKDVALFFARALMVGTIMISIAFVHFVLALLGKTEQYKSFLWWSYSLFWFFNLANIFTPFIVSDVAPFLTFPYWPQPGFLFHPFLFAWFFYFIYGTIILVISYLHVADKTTKAQIKYVLIGVPLAYVAGMANWPGWYGIPIPPILNPVVSIYVIILGYATLKHHLFNIRVLVVEVLTFIIWGLLLARVVTSGTSVGVLLPNLGLFFAVVIIGIFLIRAGLHEAKLNSQLEDLNQNLQRKVDEQTKEIRTAYDVERQARLELEDLNRAKNDFILAAQHNLRTPLTVAKGYIEEIDSEVSGEENPRLQTHLDKTTVALDTMSDLVNNLIDVTELKVGKGGIINRKDG